MRFCSRLITVFLFLGICLISSSFAGTQEAREALKAGRYEEALKELLPLVEQGDAEAQYNLGILYRDGLGIKQDYKMAVALFGKSAEQGFVDAQYNLAVLYGEGKGVEQDVPRAVALYHKAAEQGFAWAQYNLGVSYRDGLGIEKDYTLAIEWFQKAAAQEHKDAQDKLDKLK